MNVTSHIFESIAKGEARKANGPIEHWLTTLATGFWGFDDNNESCWREIKKGDVLVFQATPPNDKYVSRHRSIPKKFGFIGAGIVDRTSRKKDPRWLSEVIESRSVASASAAVWPYLVHFSDVLWFGDVSKIPAKAVQEMIQRCKEDRLDLHEYIVDLAKNCLTTGALKDSGFTFAAMGTGRRLKKNADKLADIFKSQAILAARISYGSSAQVDLTQIYADIDVSAYKCMGTVPPSERKDRPSGKAIGRGRTLRNRDYLQEAADNQRLGLIGERIVLRNEEQRVRVELGEEYVKLVEHVSITKGDGEGYDIRSVRKGSSGISEYFLEVKTTTGDANASFFVSENEVSFATANADSYEIVRIHSLNQEKEEYLEYRLLGHDFLGMARVPVNYRVDVRSTTDRQDDE